jgi:hypothetical protein
VFIYIWFIFFRSIELIYLSNCFKYLSVSSLLLTGHLPTFNTLLFSCAFSFTSLSHLNVRWSTVCVPCLHGHSGHPIIFNRCKYDYMFPWPVIITVIFGLRFKFTASLPSTLGKNSLVIAPFVVSFHWLCHFLMLCCRLSLFLALVGNLLYVSWWILINQYSAVFA